ncbi:CDP-alcohol phosphatidyltransferase family protein [Chromobacterium sp. CV08]|uniref:CDP-alcohol phosphatidyltransferase family protein n=1 Tax=Chromobacterium sp. CV08 TaxID=3133274 RepID=UPI003DA97B1D
MPQPTRTSIAIAWSVHALTACGMILGMLALQAMLARDWRLAICYLLAALALDGIDGPLARRFEVGRILPRYSGAILDLLVDYFTFVLLPALFVCWSDAVPEAWRWPAALAMMLSALYHYGNLEIKTDDCYFTGFPAFWNIVVFYLYLLRPPPEWSLALIGALCLLTFVPVKCVHPFRVARLRRLNIAAAAFSMAAAAGALFSPFPRELAWLSLAPVAYFAALSLHRTMRPAAYRMREAGDAG